MTLALFVLGLLTGAAILAALVAPRLWRAVGSARVAREGERAASLELQAAVERHRAELDAVRLQALREAEHAARLAGERESAHERQLVDLRAATEEKIALVSGNREQFAEQMKAISTDALRQVSEQVEKLAAAKREADRATAAGELGRRTEEIKRTLDPIAQNLKRVSGEVARLEQDRRTTHGQVRQMFESMSAEVGRLRDQTGTLVSALKRPQVRGAWGEMQLRNCVAAANMTEHVDFAQQQTLDAGVDGRLRPDMVVRLPGGGRVVVDAKVPMDAYLQALEERDEARQSQLLDRHAAQLRAHVDALGAKAYHAQFQ